MLAEPERSSQADVSLTISSSSIGETYGCPKPTCALSQGFLSLLYAASAILMMLMAAALIFVFVEKHSAYFPTNPLRVPSSIQRYLRWYAKGGQASRILSLCTLPNAFLLSLPPLHSLVPFQAPPGPRFRSSSLFPTLLHVLFPTPRLLPSPLPCLVPRAANKGQLFLT